MHIKLKCKSHQLSQAEIIAKRCRGMKSKVDGDKEAEDELLNIIGTLEMVISDMIDVQYLYTQHIRDIYRVANNFDSIHEFLYTERRC